MENIEITYVNIYLKKDEDGEYDSRMFAEFDGDCVVPKYSGIEIIGYTGDGDDDSKAYLLNSKGEVVCETVDTHSWDEIFADGDNFREANNKLCDNIEEQYSDWVDVPDTWDEPGYRYCRGISLD